MKLAKPAKIRNELPTIKKLDRSVQFVFSVEIPVNKFKPASAQLRIMPAFHLYL
jgi:hypothetical protein